MQWLGHSNNQNSVLSDVGRATVCVMDSVRLWMLSCLLFVVQSANDCPEKCSCSPMGSVRDHQNWHRAQSDYR